MNDDNNTGIPRSLLVGIAVKQVVFIAFVAVMVWWLMR